MKEEETEEEDEETKKKEGVELYLVVLRDICGNSPQFLPDEVQQTITLPLPL